MIMDDMDDLLMDDYDDMIHYSLNLIVVMIW